MWLHLFSAVASLIAIVVLQSATAGAQGDQISLPALEQEAVYRTLESINSGIPWRTLYPDDLCLSGPHGLVCDFFTSGNTTTLHVTELNFGYVSDFSANPSCGPNATLPSLVPFPHLRKLFIYQCFTGLAPAALPPDLWAPPPSLEELVLLHNPSLTGRLTSRIDRFPRLRRLIISGTAVSGAIPNEIGRLRSLEQLVLSWNRLRGFIPAATGRCEHLKILDLSGNRLGGRIPATIGRIGELAKLDLSSNRVSGPVPAELAGLRQLELLDLSRNRLTGGVPVALSGMRALLWLDLSGNGRLGGRIPADIWANLGGILGLGLSGVGLVGEIPASMGLYLQNVRHLALDNNALEGELPEQLRRLELTAGEINLANNSLRGQVPFSVAFVARMGGKLKLSGNPLLCLGEDLVGPARGRGDLRYLPPCNGTEIPQPVLLLSSGIGIHSFSKCHAIFSFLFFIFFIITC